LADSKAEHLAVRSVGPMAHKVVTTSVALMVVHWVAKLASRRGAMMDYR
jgi:hypothetical protein